MSPRRSARHRTPPTGVRCPGRFLRVEETEQGPPAADEVAIDMLYASVNPLDTCVLAGQVADGARCPARWGWKGWDAWRVLAP